MWLMLRDYYLISVGVFVFVCSMFPVDIWSVGCIMGEMVKGSVIFQGTDRILFPFSSSLCHSLSFHQTSI